MKKYENLLSKIENEHKKTIENVKNNANLKNDPMAQGVLIGFADSIYETIKRLILEENE